MKRNFFLSAALALFAIQASASGHLTKTHYQFVEVITSPPEQKLDVDVHMRNFNKADRSKINRGVEILKKVMNSKRFKELMHGFVFQDERQFNDNNGMTNEEIFEHLMTGGENLKPEHDHTMDFDLTLYRSWNPFSKVKGYTLPDTMRIWIHKKFFRRRSWTPVDVAANLAHEWVHKMGFGHDYNYNPERPYSVPYAVGGIVAQIAEEMGY